MDWPFMIVYVIMPGGGTAALLSEVFDYLEVNSEYFQWCDKVVAMILVVSLKILLFSLFPDLCVDYLDV